MTDVMTKAKRSEVMSRIKGRNSKPELAVRSILHRMGYRFRLHGKDLPGKPDIILPRYRTVIFVHGCFWHRHQGCRFAYVPKSREEFWRSKFDGNVVRDRKVKTKLHEMGWRVVTVWECEIRSLGRLARNLDNLLIKKRNQGDQYSLIAARIAKIDRKVRSSG